MNVLGISAYYHDSAACIVGESGIIAAAQEERFTRIKHDSSFPKHAIQYCLTEANITPSDIDYVVFYDKPFLKFRRLIETYVAFAPKGFSTFAEAIPVWLTDKLFQKNILVNSLSRYIDNNTCWNSRLLFSEHHLSHAASAFFPSPFANAAVLTMDGVGEWATTSLAIGDLNKITIEKEIHFPHSIGLLYSAFTYYSGFKVNSGEYKLMGLAPYGSPKFAKLIRDNLIDIKDDGTFALDMSYFDYCTGFAMTNERFHKLFGGVPRIPESIITQREMDLASSIQVVTEEIVTKLAKSIRATTGEKNLCMAGGVALNCVANGRLLRENIFDKIWIQPASGDAGGALGAALAVYHQMLDQDRFITNGLDCMNGSYLGPSFSQIEIEARLHKCGAIFNTLQPSQLTEVVAELLADGKAVGWMNGRMEFGPRSLGARSIIADPRSAHMQKTLNLKVKYRESFRPFAPSVLSEDVSEWFDLSEDSPYMLIVAEVSKSKKKNMSDSELGLFGIDKLNVPRSVIPAVTHVDYSARIQTVHKDTNPLFHALITSFKNKTGCPVLVNTSFNVRGEPIVCSPEDAFRCFMGTELDVLVVGNSIMIKQEQVVMKELYQNEFEAD